MEIKPRSLQHFRALQTKTDQIYINNNEMIILIIIIKTCLVWNLILEIFLHPLSCNYNCEPNLIDNITLTNYETRHRHELGCYLQPVKKLYFRNSCVPCTVLLAEWVLCVPAVVLWPDAHHPPGAAHRSTRALAFWRNWNLRLSWISLKEERERYPKKDKMFSDNWYKFKFQTFN